MIIESVEKRYARQSGTRGQHLLSLLVALAVALTIGARGAKAQIVDGLEANIPFQFHAGNTDLPAGEYRIHMLDDSSLTVMEITSADGATSALFQVEDTRTKATPAKSELIFNKYGDQYFLAKLFEEGSASGSQVLESRDERMISQQTTQAQEHVPARQRVQ
jgi:hypothetical protein